MLKRIPIDPETASELVNSERWSKKIAPGDNGCIVWTGQRSVGGYGYFSVSRKDVYAHRVAWAAANKVAVPDVLDHLCRNRACVNPDHLEAVSFRENVLRGVGVTAMHARQSRCIRGHELLPKENGHPHRVCSVCSKESRKQRFIAITWAARYLDVSGREFMRIHGEGRMAAETAMVSWELEAFARLVTLNDRMKALNT